jgi:YgiT-type zinc finger domain-containing protein
MILVTGGTGLLGSRLLYDLTSRGEKVRAIKRSSSNLDVVRKVFEIDSEIVVVDNLPAKICNKCGEESFTRDTLAHLQRIVYN